MINITAKIDNELANISGQMPFVTSLALNKTAIGARDTIRAKLPEKFKLRNQWTSRGIQVKTSNKTNLLAVLSAPGYMQIQETGGERKPERSKLLAAPSDVLRTGRVIPKSKRPRALIDKGDAYIVGMKDGDAAVFGRSGRGRKQSRLLYWLSATQEYEARFDFEKDAREYFEHKFTDNFALALAFAKV